MRKAGVMVFLMAVSCALRGMSAGLVGEFSMRDGLPNFFAKLKAGQEVRIAYLGGSITAAPGWRLLSQQWFAGQFPEAEIKEIFAAIPGTGGELGVCRLDGDVIAHKPDLVFIEFCVNGIGDTEERGRQITEGLIRKIRTALPEADICFVYTVASWHLADLAQDKIQWTAGMMESVLPHYGVPSINFAAEVGRQLDAGALVFSLPKGTPVPEGKMLFSNDGTHPLVETGHVLYNEALIRAMSAMKDAGTVGPRRLPVPLESANWADAKRYPLSKAAMTGNWTSVNPVEVDGYTETTANRDFKKRFSELWQTEQPGAEIVFRFEGTGFGLYGISRCESGLFEVQVDQQKPMTGTFFDIYAGGPGRSKGWFYPHTLSPGLHTVRVRLKQEAPDKAGILAMVKKEPSGPRYDRNELFLGDLFMNGRLVN
jgi:lysophospholipase L1-like esterase